MNTIEIFKILKTAIRHNIFLGVFPLDLVPPVTKYPAALVVNLDSSNKPGSHWVALYFDQDGQCDYFDSYGRKPQLELKQYIQNNATKYTYNNLQVQGYFSVSCGHMCIYFLICRAHGIPFKHIIASMCDEKIYKYFTRYVI